MASDAPYPPSSSSNATDSYIGSLISLISRYEIRYEGVLYFLNVKDSTIGLKNVKSYGTEGRKKDGPQIPPSEKVYKYILFRGSDIKRFPEPEVFMIEVPEDMPHVYNRVIFEIYVVDLQVMSSPPAKAEEHPYSDPAIIQTHCTRMPFSSSPVTVGGKNQFHDTPAVISRVKPEESHPYQSGMHLTSSNQTESAQSLAASHILTPISSQSYNGTVFSHIDGISCSIPSLSQPSVLVPWTVQNQFQLYQPQSSATSVVMPTSEVMNPKPSSVTSFIECPRLSSSQTPMQLYNSPVVSSSNVNIPLSTHSPLIPSNNVATPPAISSHSFPDHSMTYPASAFGPMSGPLLTPPPSIVARNELTQPGNSVLSQMQKLYPDNDVNYAMPAKAGVFSSISSQTPTEPLQALPTSASQQSSSVPFTEEFNFEAMNEKFKKDEVWSALGRFDKKDRAETEDSSVSLGFGSREGISLTGKPNTTLAYKKDDFFDTISCNSLSQGTRTGQNRFSERMRMDVETFGSFRFRPPHQYGVSGTGRVQNFHGQYSWGRQHGYGGREGGGNMP